MFANVEYKNSSGFTRTNFSVKHRPFLYLLTLVLSIKPLLFLYIVVSWLFSFSLVFSFGKTYSFAIFGVALALANCKCVWLMQWLLPQCLFLLLSIRTIHKPFGQFRCLFYQFLLLIPLPFVFAH